MDDCDGRHPVRVADDQRGGAHWAGGRRRHGQSCADEPIGGSYDFTWAFTVAERPDGATNLVVRERYAYTHKWAALLVEPVTVISFLMSQKMLRGIRDRAERTHLSGSRAAVVD